MKTDQWSGVEAGLKDEPEEALTPLKADEFTCTHCGSNLATGATIEELRERIEAAEARVQEPDRPGVRASILLSWYDDLPPEPKPEPEEPKGDPYLYESGT